MSSPALIPDGSIGINVPTQNDIEKIRPGGDSLIILDNKIVIPTISILLRQKPELESVEIYPSSNESNVNTYIVSVQDSQDVLPHQIGKVSQFIPQYSIPSAIKKKEKKNFFESIGFIKFIWR